VDKQPRLFLSGGLIGVPSKAADLPDGNAAVRGSPFDKLRMKLTMRGDRALQLQSPTLQNLASCNQPTSVMVSLSNHAQQHCHPDYEDSHQPSGKERLSRIKSRYQNPGKIQVKDCFSVPKLIPTLTRVFSKFD
jgi:hypothetical protein